MRIVSNFHDYYDCIQREGTDPTLVYVRERRRKLGVLPLGECEGSLPGGRYSRDDRWLTSTPVIICFCGHVHVVALMSWAGRTDILKRICHTADDVDDCIRESQSKARVRAYFEGTGYWRWSVSAKATNMFFTSRNGFSDKCLNLLRDARSPIAVQRYDPEERKQVITFNESLRQYDFFRLWDPYRAYQEIAMFIANLAVPLKPIPAIPDKVMAEAKGFNKWSFRKEGKKSK